MSKNYSLKNIHKEPKKLNLESVEDFVKYIYLNLPFIFTGEINHSFILTFNNESIFRCVLTIEQ